MTIERLPGTPSTPLFLLHRLLEEIDKIDSLVVTVAWKDSEGNVSHQTCWTSQAHPRLAMASICTQTVIAREIMNTE